MLSKSSVVALRFIGAIAGIVLLIPFGRSAVASALVARSSTFAIIGEPEAATRYLERAVLISPEASAVGDEVAFLAGASNVPETRRRYLALALGFVHSHPDDVAAWESVLIAAFREKDVALEHEAAAAVIRLGGTSQASRRLAKLAVEKR